MVDVVKVEVVKVEVDEYTRDVLFYARKGTG
jgi:hypothetical protein